MAGTGRFDLDRERRLPMGAEPVPGRGVHFRVWAPKRQRVEVTLEGGPGAGGQTALEPEPGGYHSGLVAPAAAGTVYRFLLDGEGPFPDPASRYQPDGPHGPSRVVDPESFSWTDAGWPGVELDGRVFYEAHIGTLTPEGTFAAAADQLAELAAIGIGVVELMPVADFTGRFGWGYDGVDLFAPSRLYGQPDDLRALVDRAHALGLGVVLDVVYNHLGPDGNFLPRYTDRLFSERYRTEWGETLNFDAEGSRFVRELVLANARHWIAEYHLDGLRVDATQDVHDSSSEHILLALGREVRAAAGARAVVLVAENEPQDAGMVRAPERGGFGFDAMWNDDFHHSAVVAATGRREGYYSDHLGRPQELISAIKHGFLFQGQRYAWQGKRRGSPALDIEPVRFVLYLENHDQVANSALGAHLAGATSPSLWRALTALLLLAPGTPLLFQGQEFAASNRFAYFADHTGELAERVAAGRRDFLAQFPSLAVPAAQALVPDPTDEATFLAARLDLGERETHAKAYALHRDLLRLRRADPVFARPRHNGVDGAVLGHDALALRYSGGDEGDRLLLVNLGADLVLEHAPEPLLAPPAGMRWEPLWSSEDPRYGGTGTPPIEGERGFRLVGRAAVVLAPHSTAPEAPG